MQRGSAGGAAAPVAARVPAASSTRLPGKRVGTQRADAQPHPPLVAADGGEDAAGQAAVEVDAEPAAGGAFAARLIAWQTLHGRRELPWQATRDPYRVWLSEIMLQQTQVVTVVGYYQRFLQRFGSIAALAAAPLADVMPLWAGLGYYARARNLHACARTVMQRHGGAFPRSAAALAELPGIGRSTAAAIAAFCFDERAPILDGNVKRVLARCFGVDGDPAAAAVERCLWSLAGSLLPADARAMPAYTQAVMDLGATVCTRAQPDCAACPLALRCVAHATGRVAELPTPRVRRAVPLRQAQMLVAVHAGHVLLEQRPPVGLWGGLLSLPQFDDLAALDAALAALAPAARAVALPARRHAFTHFTLEFTPRLAQLSAAVPQAAEAGACWRSLAAIDALALPTPVRALLHDVQAVLASAEPAVRPG